MGLKGMEAGMHGKRIMGVARKKWKQDRDKGSIRKESSKNGKSIK